MTSQPKGTALRGTDLKGADLIVGQSPQAQALRAFVERLAHSDAPVLVTGASGTGKDVVARALHQTSRRAQAPFLAVNCGALSETLLESTLFGHKRGAFTGANDDRKGLLESAHGGTLFLDEIGEAPLSLQVKLLRFLQEGTFLPVGGLEERTVDVRILSATNRDLPALVAKGAFREDLLYRLDVLSVKIPLLRERAEDIPLLAEHFLRDIAARYGQGTKSLDPTSIALLQNHDWPGNLRELRNELERMYVLAGEGRLLLPEDCSEALLTPRKPKDGERLQGGLEPLLRAYAREVVLSVLARNPTNHSAAARECGYTLQGFKALCERVGILLAPGHASRSYRLAAHTPLDAAAAAGAVGAEADAYSPGRMSRSAAGGR